MLAIVRYIQVGVVGSRLVTAVFFAGSGRKNTFYPGIFTSLTHPIIVQHAPIIKVT